MQLYPRRPVGVSNVKVTIAQLVGRCAETKAFAAQLQIALAELFQRDTRALRRCQTSDFLKRAVDSIMEARIQQWVNYNAVFCDSDDFLRCCHVETVFLCLFFWSNAFKLVAPEAPSAV